MHGPACHKACCGWATGQAYALPEDSPGLAFEDVIGLLSALAGRKCRAGVTGWRKVWMTRLGDRVEVRWWGNHLGCPGGSFVAFDGLEVKASQVVQGGRTHAGHCDVQRPQAGLEAVGNEGEDADLAAGNEAQVVVAQALQQREVGLAHLGVGQDVGQRHAEGHLQRDLQSILMQQQCVKLTPQQPHLPHQLWAAANYAAPPFQGLTSQVLNKRLIWTSALSFGQHWMDQPIQALTQLLETLRTQQTKRHCYFGEVRRDTLRDGSP